MSELNGVPPPGPYLLSAQSRIRSKNEWLPCVAPPEARAMYTAAE